MGLVASIVRQVPSVMQLAARLHRALSAKRGRTTRLSVNHLALPALRARTIHFSVNRHAFLALRALIIHQSAAHHFRRAFLALRARTNHRSVVPCYHRAPLVKLARTIHLLAALHRRSASPAQWEPTIRLSVRPLAPHAKRERTIRPTAALR